MSLQIVQNVRAKYPTPLGTEHARFLLEAAAALNLGLVTKSGGTVVTLPNGTTVSQDALMNRSGEAWDILADGEGQAKPVFNRIDPIDPSRFYFVPPVPPVVEPTPVEPTPTTPPPTVDLSEVLAQLSLIKSLIEAKSGQLDVLADEVQLLRRTASFTAADITTCLTRLKNPPFYKTKFFGTNVTLNPEVR